MWHGVYNEAWVGPGLTDFCPVCETYLSVLQMGEKQGAVTRDLPSRLESPISLKCVWLESGGLPLSGPVHAGSRWTWKRVWALLEKPLPR